MSPPRLASLQTGVLLRCAAIGAAFALLLVLLNPVTSGLAIASPALYALVASVHVTGPLLAYRLTERTGAATFTAAVMALIAAPLSTLGLLLFPALLLPALAIDAVLLLTPERWSGLLRTSLAALVGSLVIFGISLPIVDPERLHLITVVAILLGRIAGYQAANLLSAALARALKRALGRPRS